MRKIITALALLLGVIWLAPSVASAHHPVITGQAQCEADGTYAVSWTITSWQSNDMTWSITSPFVAGPQPNNTPFAHQTTAAGDATSASLTASAKWSNNATGTRTGTVQLGGDCTPPTTTTVPPPVIVEAFVRVTPICKGESTYTLRVRQEAGPSGLPYNLQVGGTVVIGGLTTDGTQFFEIPNGTNGIKAVPFGDWVNTYGGTGSTPQTICEVPETTVPETTVPETTVPETTTPPPPVTTVPETTTPPPPVTTVPATTQPPVTETTEPPTATEPPVVETSTPPVPPTAPPTAPTPPPPPPVTPSGELPATGGAISGAVAALAGLLVLAGLGVVYAARRKPTQI